MAQIQFWRRARLALIVRAAAALALAAGGLSAPTVAAQSLQPKTIPAVRESGAQQIQLYIVQQSLVSAFETLGALANASMQVDPSVDRIVAGVMLQGTMPEAVAQLARLHGMFYWFDGVRFVIAPSSALGRWVISAGAMDDAAVAQMLANVAPALPPDAVRFDAQSRLLHVTGTRELKDALDLAVDGAGRDRPGGISVIRHGISAR
jgi:hypothetical protein